jgi:septal ring factor EnvC (AmiA/AmiB activator)
MRMNLVVLALAMCLAVVLTGCGPDTAAELKKTQDNLSTCDRQAAELSTELTKSREKLVKIQQELDQKTNDLKFFANKVNPLEQQGFELRAKIETLTKELDETKKALADANKVIADMKAPIPAPAAPAATNGSAAPRPQ